MIFSIVTTIGIVINAETIASGIPFVNPTVSNVPATASLEISLACAYLSR